jgi:hypothetical protein
VNGAAASMFVLALSTAVLAGAPLRPAVPQPPAPCARCGWTPPATGKTVTVRTVRQLHHAVSTAAPDTTILVEDGEYRLESMLDFTVPHVVLRGKSGDAANVVLRGDGMTEGRVGVALSVSAPDVTIADLTAGWVAYHGIQIRGERAASRTVVHNVRVFDAGQQLLKGSTSAGGPAAEDVVIACSRFGYTDTAPTDYTDGVDALGVRHWTVRDNRFERIRGPRDQRYAAGPAILLWNGSSDSVVERNIVVDSYRGIALGLVNVLNGQRGDTAPLPDHQGGIVRNNVVWNLNSWADEGIEANGASGLRIDHNTVLVEGGLSHSISLRFPLTAGVVRNNLTNRRIVFRNGGRAELQGNLDGAIAEWFVAAPRADLHLARPTIPAIERGVALPEVPQDFDRRPRPTAIRPDVGAFEFTGSRVR